MFQQQVNTFPALGVAGDFASTNPRATVNAGAGGLVAGPGGVTVGKFAWVMADNKTVTSYGQAGVAPAGFVHREQQALIGTYLQEESMVVPEGFPVTLHRMGDFFANVAGATAFVNGASVYASYADGSVLAALPTGASVTGILGSTNTAALGSTFTATATGTSLAVTAVTGLISIGDTISGTGVTAGTTIVAQVSGTTGGAGTYTTSVVSTAAAATVTSFGTTVKVTASTSLISVGDTISGGAGFPAGATVTAVVSGGGIGAAGVYTISAPGTAYTASATGVTTWSNVIDVTAIGSGVLAVGDEISGTNIPANASIASQVSGTPGGIGVYTLNVSGTQYVASETLTVVAGIVTSFTAMCAAAVGTLVKIGRA